MLQKRNKFVVCTALLLCCLLPDTGHAGGWTQKRGEYYLKASLSFLTTREQLSLTGHQEPLNAQFPNIIDSEFSNTNLSLYLEYGLFDGLTAIATASLHGYTSSGRNTSNRLRFENEVEGFGDLYIGSRIRLLGPPFVVALQPMLKLPTADADTEIPIGSGHLDAELRLQVGTVLPLPLHNYVTGDFGFTRRGGSAFHDDVPYLVEFGVFATQHLILKAAVDGRKSLQSIPSRPPKLDDAVSNRLISDQDLTRLWGGVMLNIHPRVQLSLEVSVVIAGKNTLAGETTYLGLALIPPQ